MASCERLSSTRSLKVGGFVICKNPPNVQGAYMLMKLTHIEESFAYVTAYDPDHPNQSSTAIPCKWTELYLPSSNFSNSNSMVYALAAVKFHKLNAWTTSYYSAKVQTNAELDAKRTRTSRARRIKSNLAQIVVQYMDDQVVASVPKWVEFESSPVPTVMIPSPINCHDVKQALAECKAQLPSCLINDNNNSNHVMQSKLKSQGRCIVTIDAIHANTRAQHIWAISKVDHSKSLELLKKKTYFQLLNLDGEGASPYPGWQCVQVVFTPTSPLFVQLHRQYEYVKKENIDKENELDIRYKTYNLFDEATFNNSTFREELGLFDHEGLLCYYVMEEIHLAARLRGTAISGVYEENQTNEESEILNENKENQNHIPSELKVSKDYCSCPFGCNHLIIDLEQINCNQLDAPDIVRYFQVLFEQPDSNVICTIDDRHSWTSAKGSVQCKNLATIAAIHSYQKTVGSTLHNIWSIDDKRPSYFQATIPSSCIDYIEQQHDAYLILSNTEIDHIMNRCKQYEIWLKRRRWHPSAMPPWCMNLQLPQSISNRLRNDKAIPERSKSSSPVRISNKENESNERKYIDLVDD